MDITANIITDTTNQQQRKIERSNANAHVILALCSHLYMEKDVKPFEPKEWRNLAQQLRERRMQPQDLLNLSPSEMTDSLLCSSETAARIVRLLDRESSLNFQLDKYAAMGIFPVTRSDSTYPKALKRKLGNACPPIFYCAGELSLLTRPTVGYVGARFVEKEDGIFTRQTVRKTVERGWNVVSGGAKGVDTIAESMAVSLGGGAVEYICDSMLRKLQRKETLQAVRDGKLLILSVVNPEAEFYTGIAMLRNRFIYAHSEGAVVIRSGLGKGGTWSGATGNLRHRWCRIFCWDNARYPGNQELIRRGAIPIDENWTGDALSCEYEFIVPSWSMSSAHSANEEYEQLCLF